MLESFVDLAYRGLSLGRRIKLTQVRPSTGYLEHPTPMPVGTALVITTDDGLSFDAVVTVVHEQVGGSDRPPGMTVKPALGDAKAAAWWKERVTLPELEAVKRPEPPPRAKSVTVRPRSHTIPNPVPAEGVIAMAGGEETTIPIAIAPMPEPPPLPMESEKKTVIMDAVDQELLEQLSRTTTQETVRTTGEHPVVDDGQRTIVMDAVDPAALGLEPSASGEIAVDDDDEEEVSSDSQPIATNGGKKKKRKKRR